MSRFLNFRMTLGNDSSVILSSFKCQGKYGQLQYAARKKVRQSIFCVVRCHVPNCVGSKHRGSALSSPRRARGEVRQELQGLPVGDRAAATRAGGRAGARLGSQGRGWGPEETAGIALAPRPGREGLGEKDAEQGTQRYPGRSHDGSASKSYKFDFFKKDRLFF